MASSPAEPEHPPLLGDYGFLSDCHSAALVSPAGSIDWWCVPRFDSPSVFGRLLGPDAGHWSLTPVGPASSERAYVGESLVVRTTVRTPAGVVTVTDGLSLQPGVRGHELGAESPHALVRTVEGIEGVVDMHVEIAPAPEYGLAPARWRAEEDSWSLRAGPVLLRLASEAPLEADRSALRGTFSVRAGEQVSFCLSYCSPYDDAPSPLLGSEALPDTVTAWESWSSTHRGYDGRHRELVRRSALVLQGLTYQRTGAVVAAATTSLPEDPGGELNWDYRFTWLRDMSLTMQALWVAACPHEAHRFLRFFSGAVGHVTDEPLQIMYGVDGQRDLTEHTLAHLPGYRDSRPVRVGNDAWKQQQLDVLGEVVFAAHLLRDQIGTFDEPLQELLVALADQAARNWEQPDSGMWESRGEPRQYTSSKVMCWVALDRAIALADRLGAQQRVADWERARDAIHAAVLERAWSPAAGAYAGALGSDHLDASVLMLPLVGFLPADDARMLATIDAIRADLAEGALVRRWKGDTAAFLICSFWMVECLALAGRSVEAGECFEQLLGYGNDLGLFAEEVHVATGEQWGNFPQAFSHVGLINAAWRLAETGAG